MTMIKPANEDIGRKVVYKRDWMEPEEFEEGVITSISKTFVFVRYGRDVHSKATYPRDLDFI